MTLKNRIDKLEQKSTPPSVSNIIIYDMNKPGDAANKLRKFWENKIRPVILIPDNGRPRKEVKHDD